MPATVAAPPPSRQAWWAVLGAFLVCGTVVGSWGARLVPFVRRNLDLGDGALGTALLGASVGAVVGAWLGGLLEQRLTSRTVILVAWPALGLATTTPAFMPSWATLAASLLVLGLAMGLLDVSMNAAAVILEQRAGRPLMSGLHGGWSGGLLVGAGLGSIGVALDVPARAHLVVVGVALAGTILVARPWLPRGPVTARAGDPAGRDGGGARNGGSRMVALAAIAACVFLAEGAAIDWSAVLVDDAFGGTALLGSLSVTGVSAGGLLGRVVGDRLVARFGPTRVVRAGATVGSTGLALALVLAEPVLAPVLLFLVGFGLASAIPLAFGGAGRSAGSRGIAIVTTAGYGAYMTGPAVIGGLAELVGLRGAFVVPVVLVAIVGLLAPSIGRDTEPRPELAPPLGAAD